jgi:hypothetical protein
MSNITIPTIYSDNIQSSTTSNINLYTNKNSGTINIGSPSNTTVYIPTLQTDNITVQNAKDIRTADLTVNNLTINDNITYLNNNTTYYFNYNNSTITHTGFTVPTSPFTPNYESPALTYTVSPTSILVRSFTMNASILNNLGSSIIEMTLYSSVINDINCSLQYYFTITGTSNINTPIYYTSNNSDDVNDLVTSPDTPTPYILRKNVSFNSTMQDSQYSINIYILLNRYTTSTLRKLNIYFSTFTLPSKIDIYKYYSVGYNCIMTNNYIFSNTAGVQDTSTNTGTSEIQFGIPITLSKGIWSISMYTTLSIPATTYNYFMTYYKSSNDNNIISDSYSYNYLYNPTAAVLQQNINNDNILIITNNCEITPFIKLLAPYTGNTLTFKNINSNTGALANTASGYTISRIG